MRKRIRDTKKKQNVAIKREMDGERKAGRERGRKREKEKGRARWMDEKKKKRQARHETRKEETQEEMSKKVNLCFKSVFYEDSDDGGKEVLDRCDDGGVGGGASVTGAGCVSEGSRVWCGS